MRISLLMVFFVGVLTGVMVGQPQHGNLILTVDSSANPSSLLVLDPTTGRHTTLGGTFANQYLGTVRMAPNNTDVVVPSTRAPNWWPCDLLQVSPLGQVTTAASVPRGSIEGLELDHNDTWIAVGMNYTRTPIIQSECWSIRNGPAPVVTTLFSRPGWGFIDMTINRDPGASMYAIGYHTTLTTTVTPKLFAANRNGIARTIVQGIGNPLLRLTALQLDPTSGDYLVTMNQLTPSISRVTDVGAVTSLASGIGLANSIRLNQDRTFWVGASSTGGNLAVYHFSSGGTVLTIFPIAGLASSSFTITGIEVYGSRTLVCDQVSAATVNVRVQSRHPFVRPNTTQYALAASFARRTGIRFAQTGECLNLDVTSPLFLLSAQGVLPSIFQGFQGTLVGGNGVATAAATIKIPSGLRGSKIPVFVAGVLYDITPKNVVVLRQVTNTHWFVL